MSYLAFAIILAGVRMHDETYWLEIKRLSYQFFGELPNFDAKQQSLLDGNQATFLMSSYNIELVHIILKAVSEYTVGTPKSKDDYKVY